MRWAWFGAFVDNVNLTEVPLELVLFVFAKFDVDLEIYYTVLELRRLRIVLDVKISFYRKALQNLFLFFILLLPKLPLVRYVKVFEPVVL